MFTTPVILEQQSYQWSSCAIDTFAPVYPKSIHGTSNNQRGGPGDR